MPIVNNKVTVCIHPFWCLSPDGGLAYSDIKDDFLVGVNSKVEDPNKKLIEAGFDDDEIKYYQDLFDKYCKGVQFAKDSLFLVCRTDDELEIPSYERYFYDFCIENVPAENLLIMPELIEDPSFDIEKMKKEIEICAGDKEKYKELQFYAFGEAPSACLPGVITSLAEGIKNKPILIGSFCWNPSFEDFESDVKKHFYRKGLIDDEGYKFNDLKLVWEPPYTYQP